jgi:hypothetical protein
MMLAAWVGCTSKKSPSSTDLPDELVHVVGLGALSGISVSRLSSMPVPRVVARPLGRSWRLDSGRKSKKSRVASKRVDVVLERDVGDADLVVWVTRRRVPPGSPPRWYGLHHVRPVTNM